MKLHWRNVGQESRTVLLAICLVGLLGCSTPAEKANAYYEKGLALMAQGDLLKARIELQNALQIRPDLAGAWFALAQIAEQQGDWDKLFGLLNKVVDYDPRHLEAQIKLGRLLLAAGRLDKAQATSDAAFALAPENAEVLGLRAGVLYKRDDVAGAVLQANAALVLNPDNIDALVVLATERLAANDAESAVQYLDRGLRGNEKNIALQLIKVQAFDALAKTDSAEAVFRRLIALYPQTRALRQALAQFYVAHGRIAAAEAEYRAIAAENPTEIQARLDVVRFIGDAKGPEAALQQLRELIVSDAGNNQLNFALVSMLQSQGDHAAAEAVLRSIISKAGSGRDAIKAKGLLAGILLANGDKPAAQRLIGEVLVGDKRNEEGLLLKASLEIDEHQIDQAIADLRTILRDSPNSPRALLLQAKAHEFSGAFALAQESYLQAYEAGKPAVQFGLAYAEFLLQRGQVARAEAVVTEVLLAEPQHVPALKLLAQARINQSNWLGAQAVADQVGELPGQEEVAEQIRGTLFAARNEYAQSIAAFRRAYDAAPLDVQPMVSLARAYLAAGKAPEALAFLTSVIKTSPDNAVALLLQGELLAAKGDDAAAAQAFERVIELQPLQVTGYINLANLRLRAGHSAEAEKAVDRGLVKAPGNFELLMAQAGIYEVAGRFAEAITAYEALLKSHSGADIVVNNLASLLSEHGADQASLLRAYELAQRFSRSDVAHFKDTLGWASYRLGKVDEGLAHVASAAKQAPEQPVFRYHLGMIYVAQSKKELARKELEKALALSTGRGFPEAERAREALLKL